MNKQTIGSANIRKGEFEKLLQQLNIVKNEVSSEGELELVVRRLDKGDEVLLNTVATSYPSGTSDEEAALQKIVQEEMEMRELEISEEKLREFASDVSTTIEEFIADKYHLYMVK